MSVRWHISFTADDGHGTIGVSADSIAEGLGALADEFGEEVIVYYEHARNELQTLVDTEAGRHPAGDVRSVDAPAGDTGSATAAGSERALDDALSIFAEDDADDVEQGAADQPAADADTLCTVCGAGITADRATASRLMVGSERCTDCMT